MKYLMHKIANVDDETSISIVGKLSDEELILVKSFDFNFFNSGWPSKLGEKDRKLNELFPVDLEESIKKDDFVLVSDIDIKNKKILRDLLLPKFPNVYRKKLDIVCFSTYFAHIHNDSTFSKDRGQINIIVDNPLKHALISRSQDGEYHKIIPEKGDIVFLDIHCEHAVLPNQSEGFEKMRKNPMIIIGVALGSR